MKRISLLIAILLSASLARAAQMLPMLQTFPTEANSVLQNSFHVESPQVRILANNADAAGLTITLPNGSAMSEGNAASHGFNWVFFEDPETGIRSVNVVSDTAPSGDYSFTLTATDTPATLSVTEQPGLQFYSFAGIPGTQVEVNQYFAVAMSLGTDSGLALDASVMADILDSSGNVISTVTLNDKGESPDQTADDGMYTSAASISQLGYYQVRFDVDWNGHQGLVYQPVVIANNGFGLTGGFTVSTVDTNGNGFIEAIEITFDEAGTREAGEYELSVAITDSEGGRISTGGLFADPAAPLAVTFSIADLSKLGALPWTIAKVGMMKDFQILGVLNDIGTLDIDPDSFERPPMVINGVTGDEGVDADGDGLYERLVVDIEVVTQAAGYYGVSSDLRASDRGKISDDGIPSQYLAKGTNTITLSFLGADIGGASADGPYLVSNFLIYPNFNSQLDLAKLADYVGETSNYTCDQFVGCGSDLVSEIRRIAAAMCSVLGHQLESKLNRINALEKRHPDVAERQLQALYDRAVTLEKSGACPPAEGWTGDRPLS